MKAKTIDEVYVFLAEARRDVAGLNPWRRCSASKCERWTRGEYCPRHAHLPPAIARRVRR